MLNQVVANVTAAIRERSYEGRVAFLQKIAQQEQLGRAFNQLSFVNLAHLTAGTDIQDRHKIISGRQANIALVSSYNDLISGHCPYRYALDELKEAVRLAGATAQVAGIVPAICNGAVQGQVGSELTLFSRDIVAQSVALSLSQNAFDGVLLLGSCEHVAAGMLLGAASFAHLPVAFVPAGPMQTWLTGHDKSVMRKKVAEGKLDKSALLTSETRSFHSPGMCTFLGAANTLQLVLEAMGLTLPGGAFTPALSLERVALNRQLAQNIVDYTAFGSQPNPLCQIMTEHNLVNGIVASLATGGNLNLTMHLIAIAKAFGFTLLWEDFAKLASEVPVLVKLSTHGKVDINDFHAAGGVAVLLKALARRHLLHEDIKTLLGGFAEQLTQPSLMQDGPLADTRKDKETTTDTAKIDSTDTISTTGVSFMPCTDSINPNVLISEANKCFQKRAELYLVQGNLGQALLKLSALSSEDMALTAPARVFNSLGELEDAFKLNELNHDMVIVLRYQGPSACGMPSHTSLLGIIGKVKKAGYKVALVTDGRLGTDAGKLLAAVQVSPEAIRQGHLSLVQDGDLIELDVRTGKLNLLVEETSLQARDRQVPQNADCAQTFGRSLFSLQRKAVSSAAEGACTLFS